MNKENTIMNFNFRSWIQSHNVNDYAVVLENDQLIKLITDYGEASISFIEIEEGTIVEFTIISKKDDSVKFYLHFEIILYQCVAKVQIQI